MSHPSVSQARAWRPAALLELAEGWDTLATVLAGHAERFSADVERSRDWWRGAAADAARVDAPRVVSTITALARALVSAAVAGEPETAVRPFTIQVDQAVLEDLDRLGVRQTDE